uniref:Uncharacterized protein n=1 Tax=Anguilla anguilla TaxID=7936 RepID=A0A0E9VV21_ANGAN
MSRKVTKYKRHTHEYILLHYSTPTDKNNIKSVIST